jgi:uncharacterized membrane protein
MGLFSNGNSSFGSIVQSLIGLIDMLVGVLATLAVVLFFWGLVRYIKDSGDAKGHTEGRERIIWSLVAIFILFSVWGILSLMNVALFGTNLNGTAPGTGSTSTVQPLY